MSKDKLQKAEGKVKRGIIDYKDVPFELQKKWDRYNFDVAEEKVRRNEIRKRDLKRIYKEDDTD